LSSFFKVNPKLSDHIVAISHIALKMESIFFQLPFKPLLH